ncbi:MAG: amino acid ABC transporter permease [Oscillospiraceae bacterium]|jgi:putative glutamine transport system permease protein|nr:amino acid ABC transporter permease [Oscillospiraceae bacterium]
MKSMSPIAWWRFELLFSDWRLFGKAFLVTLAVSGLSLALALILGMIFGLLSRSKYRVFRIIARVYVELFQNIPLVIIAFFMFNALPYANIMLSTMTIGALGIGLYHGAYISEVVRAGIESIPQGQFEAANSQGFSYFSTMIHIILPQTITIILPPLTNQAVNLIKNTSVLAMISGGDLMYRANSWAASGSSSYAPALIVTGALYFIVCYPLATAARAYEKHIINAGLVTAATEDAIVAVTDSE